MAWQELGSTFESGPIDWSVRVERLDGGAVFDTGSGRVLHTASIGKILLLLEAARALRAGELRAHEPLDRRHAEPIADSGVWQHLAQNDLEVRDVIRLIGLASDNWATNVLLDRVGGPAAVRRTADALGIHDVMLHDRVRNVRTAEHAPALSEASADGLVALLRRLRRGEDELGALGGDVLDWLAGGFDLSMVAAPFGLDPLAHDEPDRGITLVNKTGTNVGVRADCGVVTGSAGTVVYACIANWAADGPGGDTLRDDVLGAMHRLGHAIRECVTGRMT